MIKIIVTGQSAPVTYNWSNYNAGNIRTDLNAGLYIVEIIEENICSQIDTFLVSQPDSIVVTAAFSFPQCKGDNGIIDLTAAGGSGMFNYFWPDLNVTNNKVDNLQAGTYSAVITDERGCNKFCSYTLTNGEKQSLDRTIDLSCADDIVENQMIPSPQDFNSVWNCNNDNNRLLNGDNSVYVQDSVGCIYSYKITIRSPTPIEINSNFTKPDCTRNNGAISINCSGGYPPYTVVWDTGDTSSNLTNLYAGTYKCRIKDSKGCSINRKLVLVNNHLPIYTKIVSNPTCNGTCNGSVFFSSDSNNISILWPDQTQDFPNPRQEMCSGNFPVIVIGSDGCLSTDTVVFIEPLPLKINVTEELGGPEKKYFIQINCEGGTTPYQYQWDDQSTLTSNSFDTPGYQSVNVIDANGCQVPYNFKVKIKSFLPDCTDVPSPYLYQTWSGYNPAFIPILHNGELWITDFGAIPDDNIDDHFAFEWANDYIQTNFCNTNTPITLFIPKGTYQVGRQSSVIPWYLKGHDPLFFDHCDKLTIRGELSAGEPASILKFNKCLKYGSFDPNTGERYVTTAASNFGNSNYGAYPGAIIYLKECRNTVIKNINFNGNRAELTIGGCFATDHAGINLLNNGIFAFGCQTITISNCFAHHFGYDGIQFADESCPNPGPLNGIISNCKLNYNARQGLAWVAGDILKVVNTTMSFNGFGEWGGTSPGAGIDIENEGGGRNPANGIFYNCEFKMNKAAGVITDQVFQPSTKNFSFIKCRFISSGGESYSVYPNARKMRFLCSEFYGTTTAGYSLPNQQPLLANDDHLRYSNCSFNEDYLEPNTLDNYSMAVDNIVNCTPGAIAQSLPLIEYDYASKIEFNNCQFHINKRMIWFRLQSQSSSIFDNNYFTDCKFYNHGYVNTTPGNVIFNNFIGMAKGLTCQNVQTFVPINNPAGFVYQFPTCNCSGSAPYQKCNYLNLDGSCNTLTGVFPYPKLLNGSTMCDPCNPYEPPTSIITNETCSDIFPGVLSPVFYEIFSQNTAYSEPATCPCTYLPCDDNIGINGNRLAQSQNIKTYQILPSPVKETLKILGMQKEDNYIITNIQGQTLIKGIQQEENEINVSYLQSGAYFVIINNKTALKLIKE